MSETLPRGGLPDIQFVNTNPEAVATSIVSEFEQLSGRTLAPGDPIRLLLLSIASIIAQERVLIDDTGKQNLLSYARGEYLDMLGYMLDVTRNPAARAQTRIQFTLSAMRPGVTTIPAGTQLAAGAILFETIAALEIPAGTLTGIVNARALVGGTAANGLLPGEVKTIVNPIPYVQSATNLDTTTGGSNIEDDASFAERIHRKPESFSVAGPAGAYEYWTYTASASIADVAVSSPEPGTVDVRILLQGGELPGPAVIEAVEDVLADKRPMTDLVLVDAPETVEKDLTVEYWIARSNTSRALEIQEAVEQAVNDYLAWQNGKIGRDITPDQLRAMVIQAGAKRLTVTGITDEEVEMDSVARVELADLIYEGLEDD